MRSVSPKVVLSSPYKELRLKKMPACTVSNFPSRPDLFKTEYMSTENGIILSESETSGSEKSDFFKNYPNSASSNGSSADPTLSSQVKQQHQPVAIALASSDVTSSPYTSSVDTSGAVVVARHHQNNNSVVTAPSSSSSAAANKIGEPERSFSPELHCCERMSDSDETGSQYPDPVQQQQQQQPSSGSKMSQSNMVLNLLANSSTAASVGGANQQEIYQQILAAIKNGGGGPPPPPVEPPITVATDQAKDLSLPNAKRRKLDTSNNNGANRRSSPASSGRVAPVPTSNGEPSSAVKRKSNSRRNNNNNSTPTMATMTMTNNDEMRARSNESFESCSTGSNGGSSFESVRRAELSRGAAGVDATPGYGSLPAAINPFLMGYGLNPFGFPAAAAAQPHLPLGYPPAAAAHPPPHQSAAALLGPVVGANPFLAAASNPMLMNQLLWRELLLSSSIYPPMFTPPMPFLPGAVPPSADSTAHLMEEHVKAAMQQMNGGVVGRPVPPPNVNLFQHQHHQLSPPQQQQPQHMDNSGNDEVSRKRRFATSASAATQLSSSSNHQQKRSCKQQSNKPQPGYQQRPLPIHPNVALPHDVTASNSPAAGRKHRSIKSEITTPTHHSSEMQHSKSSHHRMDMKKFPAAHPVAAFPTGSQTSMGSDDGDTDDKNKGEHAMTSSGGEKQGRRSGYKSLTKQRRLVANARERTRVHTIGSAFEELRMQIPSYSCNQKLSKLAILRIACRYIQALSVLSGRDQEDTSFSQGVDQCTRVLQAESRARSRRKSNKAQIEWEMASYERQRTTTTSSSTTTTGNQCSPQHHQLDDDQQPSQQQQQQQQQNAEMTPQQHEEIRHQRSKSMEIDVESVDAPAVPTTSADPPTTGSSSSFYLPSRSPPDNSGGDPVVDHKDIT